MTLILKGKAEVCKDGECTSVGFLNKQQESNSDPLTIVTALQRGLDQLVTQELCK
jgi:hypothetical protein